MCGMLVRYLQFIYHAELWVKHAVTTWSELVSYYTWFNSGPKLMIELIHQMYCKQI